MGHEMILEKPPLFRTLGAVRLLGFFILLFSVIPIQSLVFVLCRSKIYVLPRFFHASFARLIGMKIRVKGTPVVGGEPLLYVANHTSYLDISVLGSLIAGTFIAKSEVASWPLFGLMARLQNSVFIERRAARAALQREGLTARLQEGCSLCLFPEGTSTDGTQILPFKSSLFSLAEKGIPGGEPLRVQPVTIVCTAIAGIDIRRAGSFYYAWYGDMTLVPHLWRALCVPSFTVDVVFHPPATIKEFPGRKILAEHCQRVIARSAEGLLKVS
ncbi:MAG: 1-acyl-sn-glycerol-3-phosphate acyltransferase [Alphaproteobacteria bacterium]|nr:1-acyl-sn-glycerol-3-phosphate acyltransferase [Alphaproteobacteria bacterium]